MLENKSNTEEDRVAVVEAQLAQAKLIAEEADKKYEEVKITAASKKLILLHYLSGSHNSLHIYLKFSNSIFLWISA